VKDHSDMSALIPAFITGLSLYLIPSWVTEKVDLRVTAELNDKQYDYELNDSVKLVQWLPMIFAFPFTGTQAKNSEELMANTYNNLILQLSNDQFL
jgi:hypothetical protein